jgi:hypothetical protein
MQIAYHLGVHCTDDDRLVNTLHRNAPALAEAGIEVPDPARYRSLIRDAAVRLNGLPATTGFQDALLDHMLETDDPDRLVLSWENFLAFPTWAVRGAFYRSAGERMRAITGIFPDHEAEFFLAVRNPATFLPELFRRQRETSFETFIRGTDPETLRWSNTLRDLRAANPDVPITVWADEDSPLVWPEVLQAVADLPEGMHLEGTNDLLAALMMPQGMGRLSRYLASRKPATILDRRRIVSTYLDRFGRPEVMEVDVALPGWTAELVSRMTESYERDLALIATLPDVTVIEA